MSETKTERPFGTVKPTRPSAKAGTLSDFRVPTLSIECAPCGRRGRYNVARLIEKYGDMKLPVLAPASSLARAARSG